MTPLARVKAALEAAGCRASGEHVWTCPAHEDSRPSLSVSEGRDGRVLLKCHAGCGLPEILARLGLEKRELFADAPSGPSGKRREVAAYRYRDEGGKLLFEVVRFEPKGFGQRRPVAGGGWAYGLAPGWYVRGRRGDWIRADPGRGPVTGESRELPEARRVLYRLPELLSAVGRGETVYIVEGEKDVEALAALGLTATCNPQGAGKWRAEFSEALRGARVRIIPDRDGPGEAHAAAVAASLAGVAAAVSVLRLPEGKDVSEFLEARRAAGLGGEALRAELESLPAGAGPVTVDGLELEEVGVAVELAPTVAPVPILPSICMADVAPERVEWLWPPYIPVGKITLLEGDPSVGKGFLYVAIVAAVSRGEGLPGSPGTEPGVVLVCTTEDGLGDSLRPRLDAAGADVRLVHAVAEPFDLSGDGGALRRLEGLVAELRPRLVVLDSFVAYLGAGTDMHRANSTRAVLAPLAQLAERSRAAFLLIRHLSKARSGRALHAGLGSVDFTAVCRSQLLAGQAAEDRAKRALVHTKSNLGPTGTSLSYDLEAVPGHEVPRIAWQGESELRASDLLAAESVGDERSALEEAGEFLRETLGDGPRPAREVRSRADEAGIAWRTVVRAKGPLGVSAIREGGAGASGRWVWSLAPEPQEPKDAKSAKGCQLPKVALLGEVGTLSGTQGDVGAGWADG
jgi:hypothetical protein